MDTSHDVTGWLQTAGDGAADTSAPTSTRGVQATRATHVFRREDGSWRLAHRHMDHIEEAPPPTKP